MRATGRRIGRIVGQLDDLCALTSSMHDAEAPRHPEDPEQSDEALRASLTKLAYDLTGALVAASKAAQRLGELKRPS